MKKRKKPDHISRKDWDAVDIPEVTGKDFSRMRPAAKVLPEVVAAYRRSRGRPPKSVTKEQVTLRLDPDVLSYFRGKGRGWQTLLNDTLKQLVKRRSRAA